MHYNLLFNGCSYTHGGELEGINKDYEHRDRHRYSHIVSERLKKTYDNISKSGASNDTIARTTIEWFEKGNTCDLAIIQWSEIARVEYISAYAKHPVNFNSHFVITKWKGTKEIKKDHEETKLAHEYFYKHYYNPMLGVYNFYKNLYILEQFFEKHNINYYMIKMRTDFNIVDRNHKIFLHDSPNDFTNFYWKNLCKHDFFNIPSIKNTMINSRDRENFTPKYTHMGYEHLTGTHPSELGHQRIADFIINKIDTK